MQKLKEFYRAHPEREDEDRYSYTRAMRVLTDSINALLAAHSAVGWEGTDHAQLSLLLSDDPAAVENVTNSLKAKILSSEARGEMRLGHSSVRASTKEFGGWCPPGTEFSRGEYLRHVWAELYTRVAAAAG